MANGSGFKLAKVLLELRVVVADGLLDVLVVSPNLGGNNPNGLVEANQKPPLRV